ncbi:hypothetical protein GCM10010430_52270 [Kitasatospora cystarginea]|uniref:Uncharacterized protein n=1 Tax=Kitasatospora cystarginea TaxID=58350 RepID=A0ABN3EKJ8_9ACTN
MLRIDDPADGALFVFPGLEVEVDAEVGGPLADCALLTEEHEIADVTAQQHAGGAQDALLGAFG